MRKNLLYRVTALSLSVFLLAGCGCQAEENETPTRKPRETETTEHETENKENPNAPVNDSMYSFRLYDEDRQYTADELDVQRDFYEYLEDSFVEMMKIVFDSDSFKSVFSRLSAITRASQCYIDGNREEMLQILKELPSSKHSSYDDGIEVKLKQENNNNTKPESISERMILFYQLNFGLVPKPDCLRKYKDNYYQDISEFISDLEQEVKRVNQVETTSIELDNKPKKNLLSIFK